jgi:hypothetical protein
MKHDNPWYRKISKSVRKIFLKEQIIDFNPSESKWFYSPYLNNDLKELPELSENKDLPRKKQYSKPLKYYNKIQDENDNSKWF